MLSRSLHILSDVQTFYTNDFVWMLDMYSTTAQNMDGAILVVIMSNTKLIIYFILVIVYPTVYGNTRLIISHGKVIRRLYYLNNSFSNLKKTYLVIGEY